MATVDVRKEDRHTEREQEGKNTLWCDVLGVSPLMSHLGTNSPVCDEGVFKRYAWPTTVSTDWCKEAQPMSMTVSYMKQDQSKNHRAAERGVNKGKVPSGTCLLQWSPISKGVPPPPSRATSLEHQCLWRIHQTKAAAAATKKSCQLQIQLS